MIPEKTYGRLYIVATPIGHPEDITLRAIKILQQVDEIICEELSNGSKLLKSLQINKPLLTLNEHNEDEMIQTVLVKLMEGKSFALISDCGTPVFADPGRHLLQMLSEMKIPVSPIPGASSLMAAISVCPFNLQKFFFLGFLPPKSEQRISILKRYRNTESPIILMDTPYRMTRLLEEVLKVFGKKQQVFLAADLTLKKEEVLQDTIEVVYKNMKNKKKEFILIIDKPTQRI